MPTVLAPSMSRRTITAAMRFPADAIVKGHLLGKIFSHEDTKARREWQIFLMEQLSANPEIGDLGKSVRLSAFVRQGLTLDCGTPAPLGFCCNYSIPGTG